jgi:ribosome biogenesis ATPase
MHGWYVCHHLSSRVPYAYTSDLSWEKTDNKPVIVIGATNRPDSLDAALRRAGRFDHEVAMSVPDEVARAQYVSFPPLVSVSHRLVVHRILRVMSGKLRLEGDFDFVALARATPGYVGADLAALTGAAGIVAVKRIFKELTDAPPTATPGNSVNGDDKNTDAMAIDSDAPPVSTPAHPPTTPTDSSLARFLATHPDPLSPAELAPLHVSYADFTAALRTVQPSALREGFATVPDVSWADVGALGAVRDELHLALVAPVRRPDAFARLGLNAPAGVLLWGPPGCGKTLLAKAVAHESGANFISVKGPELLNKVSAAAGCVRGETDGVCAVRG